MNKTVNINLGGMFFHIDEDAYQKLSRYFDAIKRSLSNSSGQDEIIKDIEMRVSELLNEKQKSEKHVVGLKDVDEVIAVMGQPEDYRIDDDGSENTSTHFSSSHAATQTKKLYRDKDNGMIGGVLAGLGHYFQIDKVWLRILLLLVLFIYGIGILLYIILWIVMPEAVTTTQKLEMTGETVNISNIEKKVRGEYDTISESTKNENYDASGNRAKTGTVKSGNSFGNFIIAVLRVFSKFLGILLIITGFFVLAALFIGVFTLGSSNFIKVPWQNFIEAGKFTDYPIWIFGLIMFFAVGIPFFFLALLGFKLFAPNLKSIGNIAKYTLFAIWLIAVSLAITIAIKQASAFSEDGRVVEKEILNLNPKDTLLLKFRYNENFSNNIYDNKNFKITIDTTGKNVIYSNNVLFRIAQTDEKSAYIQIEKEAKGNTIFEAKERAKKIKYNYKIEGNQLIFDNYLLTELKEKFRNQEIEITLFLPLGTLLKIDPSMQHYEQTDSNYFLWNPNNKNDIYKVESDKIRCQNCYTEDENIEEDENERGQDIGEDNAAIENNTKQNNTIVTTTTLSVNGLVIKTSEERSKTKKGLSISKDGIIIKN